MPGDSVFSLEYQTLATELWFTMADRLYMVFNKEHGFMGWILSIHRRAASYMDKIGGREEKTLHEGEVKAWPHTCAANA